MMDAYQNGGFDWPVIPLPLELSPNLIHAIRVQLDLPVDQWTKLGEFLTDEEIQRGDRFRFDEPRQRFVTCRAALRQLLGHCCGMPPKTVPLLYGQHGKPGIAFADLPSNMPRIEFSVSHSGSLGLIAMTVGSPVGIDLEEFNPTVKALKLAERFFAASEADELRHLPPDKQLTGFYRGWTCKEAYIKATGRGLSLPLNSFCVSIDPDRPASLRHVDDDPYESESWTIQSLDVAPNYAAAVMAKRPNCQIACWNWPSE